MCGYQELYKLGKESAINEILKYINVTSVNSCLVVIAALTDIANKDNREKIIDHLDKRLEVETIRSVIDKIRQFKEIHC